MTIETINPDLQTREIHRCTAACPTKGGARCGRWLGTVLTPEGPRCVNHGPRPRGRMRSPRDVVRTLESLEPTLRSIVAWLDAHRQPHPWVPGAFHAPSPSRKHALTEGELV